MSLPLALHVQLSIQKKENPILSYDETDAHSSAADSGKPSTLI